MVVLVRRTRDGEMKFWGGEDWVSDSRDAMTFSAGEGFEFGDKLPPPSFGDAIGFVSCLPVDQSEMRRAFEAYDREMRRRLCPNVALVLKDGRSIFSVVLVKREVVEKDLQIIERLKREADEKYNQCLVVEEYPYTLKPDELPAWLEEMNHQILALREDSGV